jgi:hypothetical protein
MFKNKKNVQNVKNKKIQIYKMLKFWKIKQKTLIWLILESIIRLLVLYKILKCSNFEKLKN